jgi:putative membrane protein
MRKRVNLFNASSPPQLTPLWLIALALWLGALIATPIAIWTLGEESFPAVATFGVLAQCALTLLSLRFGWPWARIGATFALVILLTWSVEYLGVQTGLPFGHYVYTEALQPQLAGVPLLIPLAWMMMLPPAWAVATAWLAGTRWGENRLVLAGLSGITFTAWDLYLDPQMVAKGLWAFDYPSGYFGIPWSNFGGWWLTSTLVTFIIAPRPLPTRPLLVVYSLTCLFQLVGLGLFWGQPAPALIAFSVMGALALGAWHKETALWTWFSGRSWRFWQGLSRSRG